MIRNYFKIAWRNLKNNLFYSSINIIGLTVGLTVGLLILLWLQNELTFNHFEGREKNIYKVNSNIEMNGEVQVWHSSPGPVAAFARSEVPGVKQAVRVSGKWDHTVFVVDEAVFEAQGMAYADPELFQMFRAGFLEGSAAKPFIDNHSVIITESLARTYFGNEPALGKTIRADFEESYIVSGVIEDFPDNSSFDYQMIFPISIMAAWYTGNSYWKSLDSDWGNFNYQTFLELDEGADYTLVRNQISEINTKHDPNAASNKVSRAYELQPITQVNLYSPDGSATGIQTVRIFAIIAVLILLIASINYVNLSTARAMTRAKEVSMRKIIGAQKVQLFAQFLIESLLFILFSIILAVGLIYALLPFYNGLTDKNLLFNILDPQVWKIILAVSLFITMSSAVYPAILLSSFKPLQALKGKLNFGVGNTAFRHILVTVQFVFSVSLIIGTLIIGQQLNYLHSKDPGFRRDQIITFSASGKMADHVEAVKAELKNIAGVEDVALANGRIYNSGRTTGDTEWEGKDPNQSFVVQEFAVDESFLPMMEMSLVAGEAFKGNRSDSSHYILNETAVRLMGISDPVGKAFALHEVHGKIIGVVRDFHSHSMKYAIEPIVIRYNPAASMIYVRISGENGEAGIAAAQHLWNKYNSGFPFKYQYLDEAYQELYKSEQRTAKLFNIFCLVAVFVSCMGLFGLATYTAKVRTKEIGIRKVIGASVLQISSLLSIGFLKLVVIALMIASPVAYLAMDSWLQDFTYRISIKWYVFAATAAITILLAIITVSFQAIKAAIANPVKSLRDE